MKEMTLKHLNHTFKIHVRPGYKNTVEATVFIYEYDFTYEVTKPEYQYENYRDLTLKAMAKDALDTYNSKGIW